MDPFVHASRRFFEIINANDIKTAVIHHYDTEANETFSSELNTHWIYLN